MLRLLHASLITPWHFAYLIFWECGEILFLESIPVQQGCDAVRYAGSMHLGQAAEKADVCSVRSGNTLTGTTTEFARENWVVHVGVMHVVSGANSNHFNFWRNFF